MLTIMELILPTYLGTYGSHMFALQVALFNTEKGLMWCKRKKKTSSRKIEANKRDKTYMAA